MVWGHSLDKNDLLQTTTACALSVLQLVSGAKSRKTTYQQLICFPMKNEWKPISRKMAVQIRFDMNAGLQVTSQTCS